MIECANMFEVEPIAADAAAWAKGSVVASAYPFSEQALVGEGANGAVWKVRHTETGQLFCAKYQTMQKTDLKNLHEWQALNDFRRKWPHRNIVKGHRCFFDQGKQLQVLVMDYAQYGDLNRLVHTFKVQHQHFTKDQLLCTLVQSAEGLGWAHRHDRVHCDLKPQNFFVAGDGTILIGDFGAAFRPHDIRNL